MIRQVVLMTVVVVVLGGGIWVAAQNLWERSAVVELDQPALDFTLNTLEGTTVSLSDFRGKPVIMNFFASWCEPCKKEQPVLRDFYETYKGDAVLLLVDRAEPPVLVQQFVQEYNIQTPVLLDSDNRVSKMYRVIGQPETVLIDELGIVRYHYVGELTKQLLDDLLHQFTEVEVERVGVAVPVQQQSS